MGVLLKFKANQDLLLKANPLDLSQAPLEHISELI